MKANDVFFNEGRDDSSGLFLQVKFVLPHAKKVKDRELLLIFSFCLAGEDGERNGRCYGPRV